EDDVGPALVLARVDHVDDVGVRELSHGAGLAAKPLEVIRVGGDLAVHELHRDVALQSHVAGPVDRGHAAGPDLLVQSVATGELSAYERRHLLPILSAQPARRRLAPHRVESESGKVDAAAPLQSGRNAGSAGPARPKASSI